MNEFEMRKGEWECEDGNIRCSVCHKPAPVKKMYNEGEKAVYRPCRTNYCPHCGTKMTDER